MPETMDGGGRPPLEASERPHASPSTELEARRELRKYVGIRRWEGDDPYVRVQLAQILKVERDDEGRLTGYATVEILTMPKNSVRYSVMMPVPASQYWWVGGLPPINTLCTIGWLPQGIAVILAYYPIVFRKLVEEKGLPDLALGEVLIRGELAEDGAQRAGATILLDRDGAITLSDKDGESTVTLEADGTVTVNATTVNINAQAVNIGGTSGQELVTKDFLDEVFDSHTHNDPSSGVTGPPNTGSGSRHTTKTKAE